MEQKTIKEWLETLPEPYRTQALKNTKNLASPMRLTIPEPSLSSALRGAFSWRESPEGDDYWRDLRIRAEKGEFDTVHDKQIGGSHYKESDGKINYELDWRFVESMAKRMQKNKGKYEPYNWQKPTEVEPIKQALIRHSICVFDGNYADGDDDLGHLEAIALNAMFIWHQLKKKNNYLEMIIQEYEKQV